MADPKGCIAVDSVTGYDWSHENSGKHPMTPKEKSKIMEEMRIERAAKGLVRREVWIHKKRTREELDKAVKKLQKPPKDA